MNVVPENAVSRVRSAFARLVEVDRPDVWIHLRSEADVLADAAAVDEKVAAGAHLPLAGLLLAVKDNIDVAGLPTTAACPAYAYLPDAGAHAVDALKSAGAIVLGKTNLDQFATGLVGTRSPYGVVADGSRPELVAGGSSSGSALAVALGIADIGLATDTAGSGRVPAAFQGLLGIKPTRGLVSVRGVVPACAGLDCVSLLVDDLEVGARALAVMEGVDELDPFSRAAPPDRPLGAREQLRIGFVEPADLGALSPEYRTAYAAALADMSVRGLELVPVDIEPLLDASELLYDGAFVALRYAAVGSFIDEHGPDVDPTVGALISRAKDVPASSLARDQATLAELARRSARIFEAVDVVALPTTVRQPSIAEVAADPIGVNAELGTYAHFCNLLDLAAIAIPAGDTPHGRFGITLFAAAFHDRVLLDVAARVLGQPPAEPDDPGGIALAVFGAHLRGQPLNGQLVGGRFVRSITTAAAYELFALPTEPPKPGLLRVEEQGHRIAGELWSVPPTTVAAILTQLPTPLTLGQVGLDDGSVAVGFLVENAAVAEAKNITEYGGWLAFLAAQ